MIPHFPPPSSGYKHAGDEVWYQLEQDSFDDYDHCNYDPMDDESEDCSNSLWITVSVSAHRSYMGRRISKLCDGDRDDLMSDPINLDPEMIIANYPNTPIAKYLSDAKREIESLRIQ